MNINHAIKVLEEIKSKYGGEVEVKMDCPICNGTFNIDVLVTKPIYVSLKSYKDANQS